MNIIYDHVCMDITTGKSHAQVSHDKVHSVNVQLLHYNWYQLLYFEFHKYYMMLIIYMYKINIFPKKLLKIKLRLTPEDR